MRITRKIKLPDGTIVVYDGETDEEAIARHAAWKKRSDAAKQAVRTKRAKYKDWPCNRNPKPSTDIEG